MARGRPSPAREWQLADLLVYIAAGPDVALLPHALRHYRGLAPDRILVDLHVGEGPDPELEATARAMARARGGEMVGAYYGPYGGTRRRREAALAATADAEDWIVICDLDELHDYPCQPRELLRRCQAEGYDHVRGELVDRVAADGGFPAIDGRPLEEQFPLAARVTENLCGGDVRKVVLARAGLPIVEGQHAAPGGRACPPEEAYVAVHHFKWGAGVLARSRVLASAQLHPDRPSADAWRARERQRLLTHVERHGGRLDLGDPRLEVRRPEPAPAAALTTWPRLARVPLDPAHPERRRPERVASARLETNGQLPADGLEPGVTHRLWTMAGGGLCLGQIRIRLAEELGAPRADLDPVVDRALDGLVRAGVLRAEVP